MKDIIIAPSVLSMDYSCMKEQIEKLEHSKAKWIHFDVMDGHFVPNLSFGPDLLKGFRKGCHMFLDVHLMVEDPKMFLDPFVNAGADLISFHCEAVNNDPEKIREVVDLIHKKGKKAGLAIKPKTSLDVICPVLKDLDLVLVMSVEPGFGGQSFMEDQMDKVRELRKLRDEIGASYLIEVDGGINDRCACMAKDAGVDVMVAGSYVFKNDIEQAVESLL